MQQPLIIDILTIFPEFFSSVFDCGIIRRAKAKRLVEINIWNLRDFTVDKHKKTDDRPFGGGEGMVMKPEPIFNAVEKILGTCNREEYAEGTKVILLSPQGSVFKQKMARELADKAKRLVLICGRYEGVDERVNEALVTDEISIGDYILSGGEPAAVVIVDAIVRLLPDALGCPMSSVRESFTENLLDYPQYTQPREYRGMRVPEILLSGNHAEIEKWRRQKAIEKTIKVRRDLLEKES
ncbi:MAG: tRNA (guanosine(37)-N1)-methyltransferase TrmD [Pyrinomonadaceae bacterium]|nr:tRNA (guanosine(37)-N1)-methyltransferase TrmD [Pyrinomonadaceae bacterium]MCX7640348.1 tRNA (guanosine(37)-N1)-methyltransferase TrmD [Pyrinomonadaceae bacterium]MDW8304776.1 tRNA (guanosine(37)-N1)-methyltransferase TrmD [Acidobacteriota bacterium]